MDVCRLVRVIDLPKPPGPVPGNLWRISIESHQAFSPHSPALGFISWSLAYDFLYLALFSRLNFWMSDDIVRVEI
jgi:hypothetical protein